MDYTTSDGPGFRTSVYCSGCNHACKGCQNPQTWNILNGKPTEVKEIFEHIAANDLANVTFSGGDPFYQPKAFSELARMIKFNTDKDIWCYTGFTIEEIFKDENLMELLRWVDVLVDGRFEEDKKDPDLLFRGSSNQRLIDVKKLSKPTKSCFTITSRLWSCRKKRKCSYKKIPRISRYFFYFPNLLKTGFA